MDVVRAGAGDAAARVFLRRYGHLPAHVMNSGWAPDESDPDIRELPNGRMVQLCYWDPRTRDWASPCMDRYGTFYRAVRLGDSESLPGYGYMRRREEEQPLPPGAIEGDYYRSMGGDAVRIGHLAVMQEDMDEIYLRTGELPTHITWDDPSGSFRYMAVLEWGDEPAIIAAEQVRRVRR